MFIGTHDGASRGDSSGSAAGLPLTRKDQVDLICTGRYAVALRQRPDTRCLRDVHSLTCLPVPAAGSTTQQAAQAAPLTPAIYDVVTS